MNLTLLSMLFTTLFLFGGECLGQVKFDDIAEVVLTYQLKSQLRSSGWERFYFVSVNQREDPSSALLARLNKKGFRVRPVSQGLMKEGGMHDKVSGAVGIWLSVYDLQCKSSDNCVAKGAIQSDRDNLVGWKYQLLKQNGKWRVKDTDRYLEG